MEIIASSNRVKYTTPFTTNAVRAMKMNEQATLTTIGAQSDHQSSGPTPPALSLFTNSTRCGTTPLDAQKGQGGARNVRPGGESSVARGCRSLQFRSLWRRDRNEND